MDLNTLLNKNDENSLSERERLILRKIVHLYILKATPIGSRFLAKYLKDELNLSPATIRNVMADLEELQYISHPHTSAGRIPTDKGYRFYVDTLREIENLTDFDIVDVQKKLTTEDSDKALKEASKMLGMLSKYLGVVRFPHLRDMIVEKIEILQIGSDRMLVVIALESNIIRTVTLEAQFEIDANYLIDIREYINERVSGKALGYLKDNFEDMISDFELKDTPLVQLFVDSVDKIFKKQQEETKVVISGAQNLLEYPEFEDLSRVKGVIEMVENEDIIIHLLDNITPGENIDVMIGSEMENQMLNDYAFVKTSYNIGSAIGSIGLIGPKRMNYPKMISIVQTVSNIISS
jgi:heat-inducible transcriptional repressor